MCEHVCECLYRKTSWQKKAWPCQKAQRRIMILLLYRWERVEFQQGTLKKIKSKPQSRALHVLSPCHLVQCNTGCLFFTHWLFFTSRSFQSSLLPHRFRAHSPSAGMPLYSCFSQIPHFCLLRSLLKVPPPKALLTILLDASSHFILLFSLLFISFTKLIRFLIIVFMHVHISLFHLSLTCELHEGLD